MLKETTNLLDSNFRNGTTKRRVFEFYCHPGKTNDGDKNWDRRPDYKAL